MFFLQNESDLMRIFYKIPPPPRICVGGRVGRQRGKALQRPRELGGPAIAPSPAAATKVFVNFADHPGLYGQAPIVQGTPRHW